LELWEGVLVDASLTFDFLLLQPASAAPLAERIKADLLA